MNALPDYRVIEFFDWIKANESYHLNIGYVRECIMRDKHTHSAMEDLTPYAKEFISQNDLHIEPCELIESIRFYLTYRYADEESTRRVEETLWDDTVRKQDNTSIGINSFENYTINCQIAVPSSLHIEIEFLEWLMKQRLNTDDILKMPICVFEKLAKVFSFETRGKVDNDLLSNLLHDFKKSYPERFMERLKHMIFMDASGQHVEKYKSIAELLRRYSSPSIIKCFFLPLAQDRMFENFIRNSWEDLNSLSRDYLDIYYGVRELSASGYAIKDKFHSLDIAEDALPCLVLWRDSLDKAKCVELRGLQYEEVFHLLQSIVQNIKVGNEFDVVYSKAVLMADEKRKKHNERNTPIMSQTNITITHSSVSNSQVGTSNSQLNFNQSDFSSDFSNEISQSISEINAIAELSKENMATIIDLLKKIDASVQSGDEEAQTEAKYTLKGVLKGIGNAGVKVISVLSGLANLAKFFGFPAP